MNRNLFAAVLVVIFAAGCASSGKSSAGPASGPASGPGGGSADGSADGSATVAVAEQSGGSEEPLLKNILTSVGNDRFGTITIANALSSNLKKSKVQLRGAPLVVTTFVDLNDFSKTSIFGRVMAERMIDALSTRGFKVLEVRRGQDLFMRKGVGELILTQDVAELPSGSVRARIVLAGTYMATEDSVIINARIIDTRIPQVVSTASIELPMNADIEDMLQGISPF
jgi:TolB-like protein